MYRSAAIPLLILTKIKIKKWKVLNQSLKIFNRKMSRRAAQKLKKLSAKIPPTSQREIERRSRVRSVISTWHPKIWSV